MVKSRLKKVPQSGRLSAGGGGGNCYLGNAQIEVGTNKKGLPLHCTDEKGKESPGEFWKLRPVVAAAATVLHCTMVRPNSNCTMVNGSNLPEQIGKFSAWTAAVFISLKHLSSQPSPHLQCEQQKGSSETASTVSWFLHQQWGLDHAFPHAVVSPSRPVSSSWASLSSSSP